MLIEMINNLVLKFKKKASESLLFEKIVSMLKTFIKIMLTISARSDLKRKTAKVKTFNDYIDLSFSYNYAPIKGLRFKLLIRPLQIKYEISQFFKLVVKYQPKIVLEIGTSRGGNFLLFLKFSSPNALLISLDLPGGKFGGGYNRWVGYFLKSFALDSQKISLIRADSHKLSSLKKVKKVLKNKQIDLLYIDGDHSYEGVTKDFEMYSPLVKKGGIIAFHDIVDHPIESKCEVSKFWNEIKNNYEYKEIIENWDQKKCGIGLIKKK